jgi:hypothetical protein
MKHNPQEWLGCIKHQIESSDILISFSGMNFLQNMGDLEEEFQELIIRKVKSGTPVFCRLLEQRDEEPKFMEAITKALGASPLYYRVYSKINRPDNDPNPYCATFSKANSTLRDPELFRGVNSVYSDASVLINYTPELYPLIDIDPMEYDFIDQGDLYFHGELGMRNTIAVRGDLFNSVQILYSGELFFNSRKDLFGRLHHGINENIRFAENIIKCLSSAVKKSEDHEVKCYELFSSLERRLGILIKSKLKESQINIWIDDNSHQAKFTRSNLGQLNFLELVKIICSHWESFSQSILLDKEEFRLKCKGINKRERRFLAHPIKAENEGYEYSEYSYCIIKEVNEALSSC